MRRASPPRCASEREQQFFGMGGPRMAAAGVELVADYHEVAVVGITEVVHRIPTVISVQNRLAREAAAPQSCARDSRRFARERISAWRAA